MVDDHVPVQGDTDPSFELVRDAFTANFQYFGQMGAAVTVYIDGRPVVDLWGGFADEEGVRPWMRDTLVNVYSVTKPMAAICALVLAERGQLDLDAPIKTLWPEFDQHGKGDSPVRWILTHQLGLPALREPLSIEAMYDWDAVLSRLAAEEPWWRPGEKHGEHALFFGHLIGEIVRRVSGKSLGTFFREEVAGPWGLDFFIGLPKEEFGRAAELEGFSDDLITETLGEPGSLLIQALSNPPGLLDPHVVNGERWRSAEIPAVNGHGTAHAIARFYGGLAMGGELDRVPLLGEQMIDLATTEQCSGRDEVLGRESRFGLGFQLFGAGSFGMGGLGGFDGFGNREHRLGFGYVTNTMGDFSPCDAIMEAVQKSLGALIS